MRDHVSLLVGLEGLEVERAVVDRSPDDVETASALQHPIATVTNWPVRTPGGWDPSGNPVQQVNNVGYLTVGGEIAGDFTYLGSGVTGDLFAPLDASDPTKLGLLPVYLLAPQKATGGAGFALDQGAYADDDLDKNGYVRASALENRSRTPNRSAAASSRALDESARATSSASG